MSETELAWLAGFLEGEGSFCKGPPSNPAMSFIAFVTTDKDIAKKVASLIGGNTVHRIEPRESHWKAGYRYTLRGRRAVALMKKLRPLMGNRRQHQIDEAVEAWHQNKTEFVKLDNVRADREAIKGLVSEGSTHQEVANLFNVTRSYVTHIVNGKYD